MCPLDTLLLLFLCLIQTDTPTGVTGHQPNLTEWTRTSLDEIKLGSLMLGVDFVMHSLDDTTVCCVALAGVVHRGPCRGCGRGCRGIAGRGTTGTDCSLHARQYMGLVDDQVLTGRIGLGADDFIELVRGAAQIPE